MFHSHISNFLCLKGVLLAVIVLIAGRLIAQPRAASLRVPFSRSSYTQGGVGVQTIENDQIRVGINPNFGGAITYLAFKNTHGDSVSTDNMVNNPDLGRQIQIALYSGPADYHGYPGLGWDPIQAGDDFGHPSQVLALERQTNSLYAKTIPKQFGVNNEPGEATIEHWIRLEGNIVKVHAKVVMLRSDHTQYEARQQEFPCVYLNGDYHNMWFYRDGTPYTNRPLHVERIVPPSTMLFGDVFPTEPWMASTNDKGYGVGLYVPNNYEWKRGYFGSDLSGNETSTVGSYIAATNRVLLDYNLVYEWDYELIAGSLNKIRSYVYSKPRSSAGPNYRFDTSRKGWYYQKAQDTGWPIQNKLHVSLDDADSYKRITSPYVFWKGRDNPKIYLRAAFNIKNKDPRFTKFRLNWRRSEDQTIYRTGDRFTDFPIQNDGNFHTYEIDLSHNEDWLNHNIGQIQFTTITDNPEVPNASGWVEMEWVATSADGPNEQQVSPPVIVDPPVDNPPVVVTPPVDPPPVVVTPPVETPPVVVAPADPVPCEPGCVMIGVQKVRYVRSSRRR